MRRSRKRGSHLGLAPVRLLAAGALAIALSGCAVLPAIVSGLSGTITVVEWMKARMRAGLPTAPRADPALQEGAEATAQPTTSEAAYQAAIDEAYRQGVRDAVRQLTEGLGRDPRWTWVAPIVQEVWIPAQVLQGAFIPGHREWVMIQPGHWQAQFGLPLGPAPQIQPTGARAPAR